MSKKEKDYYPLTFCRKIKSQEGNLIQDLVEKNWISRSVSEKEYLDFVLSRNFMNPEYRGIFTNMNRLLLKKTVKDFMFDGVPDAALSSAQAIVEYRDLFAPAIVIKEWSMFKQVYKINPDFYEELICTENIVIPHNFLRHIPFDSFYIDLSEIKTVFPIIGAYVYASKFGCGEMESDQITAYMITEAGDYFSYYSGFEYGIDGTINIPNDIIPNTPFVARSTKYDQTGSVVIYQKQLNNDRRTEVIRAILQISLFLSARNADITENPVTAKTYRKTQTIKDKFSEIKMLDVGVQYGKAIRLAKREKTVNQKEQDRKIVNKHVAEIEERVRKSPRPHVRCAHWQRYHVGVGRKEIRLNWVPPVFVSKDNKESSVTIHMIEE